MDDLEKTVEEHKKALRFLYEHADKACQVRTSVIRRLKDVERWIAWCRNHGSSGWNDAKIMTPGKNGDYWVTVNEDGVRMVKVATYIGDWIVGEADHRRARAICKRGGKGMTNDQRDIEVMKRVADALPYMTEGKKGELIGYGKAMVDLNRRKEDGEKERNQSRG